MLVTAPDLPPIKNPSGALMYVQQRLVLRAIKQPRGIGEVTAFEQHVNSTPTNKLSPHELSAPWFKEAYCSYHAAHSMLYCGEGEPMEALKLVTAEDAELRDAFTEQHAPCGVDQSLKPRRVAIWLLGKQASFTQRIAKTFLHRVNDAVAHWASNICKTLRVTAAFGVDSDFVFKHFGHADAALAPNEIAVALRWCDGDIRTVWTKLDFERAIALGGCGILSHFQATAVRLSGAHDVPVPPEIFIAVDHNDVPTNAFFVHQHNTSRAFAQLLRGEPSLPPCDVGRTLTPLGIVTRIVNRTVIHQSDGLDHASSFHGALLASLESVDAAVAFVAQRDMLRLPSSAAERKLNLHICAAQVEHLHLCEKVSLYGSVGVAGKPIRSPGTWLWVSRPAIRPVDEALLGSFELIPCSKASLQPGAKELRPAFELFWQTEVSGLFKMLGGFKPRVAQTPPLTQSISVLVAPKVESEKGADDPSLLALFNLDIKTPSQRTTLGEAYCYLTKHLVLGSTNVGCSAMLDQLKTAMAALGVRASLSQMVELSTLALKRHLFADDSSYENGDTLHRFAEIALATTQKRCKKAQTSLESVVLAAECIRRVMHALCLKKGREIVLRSQVAVLEYVSEIINVMSDVVDNEPITDPERLKSMTSALMACWTRPTSAHDFVANITTGVAKALAVASWQSKTATNNCATVFILQACALPTTATKKVSAKLFKVCHTNRSTLVASSMDELLSAPKVHMLLLQELGEYRVCVTATVPSGSRSKASEATSLAD